jgi:cytoskeletal protein CcmA (bactofilin family)
VSFWKKKEDSSSTSSAQPSPSSGSPSPTGTNEPRVTPGGVIPSTSATNQSVLPRSASPNSIEDQLQDRFGKIRSALGPGTVIQGKLSFDTPVRIDGRLSGEIFSSKALIIGGAGLVDAQIEGSVLIIQGTVKGNVRVSERVELLAGARLEGDVQTPVFVIEEGALFAGNCTMSSKIAHARLKGEQELKAQAKEAKTAPITVPIVTQSSSAQNQISSKGDLPIVSSPESAAKEGKPSDARSAVEKPAQVH